GFFTMLLATLIGGVLGAVAGYLGGLFDALLSRITDIFFAIPLILGAIVIANRVDSMNVWMVIIVLGIFGWTNIARIMRGSVTSVKTQAFVTASTALGANSVTNLVKHVVPNAIAPVLVTATVTLGVYIVAEATLSFLGVGLPASSVSWGGDISDARPALRTQPMMLFYPSMALALTVLSCIMLGDAVRHALDPKARKRRPAPPMTRPPQTASRCWTSPTWRSPSAPPPARCERCAAPASPSTRARRSRSSASPAPASRPPR